MNRINTQNFIPQQQAPKKKKKQKKNILGGIGAMTVGSIAQSASIPVSLCAVNGMVKQSKSLTRAEIKTVNKAAQDVLDSITNLTRKGVKIVDFSGQETPALTLGDKINELLKPMTAVKNGKNAAFVNKAQIGLKQNSIVINQQKMPLAIFHEMGHADNFNNTKFLKALQNTRQGGLMIGMLLMILPALTKETKAENGKELSGFQKAKNWVRKNSPLLAFASTIPMIIEEGAATLKGNNWAKQILDKDIAKKVARGNAWGMVSYIGVGLSLALGAYVTKKIKDNSDAKKAMKFELSQRIGR